MTTPIAFDADEEPTKPGSGSGPHRIKLAGVLCWWCEHRRDAHLTDAIDAHECMTAGCPCPRFTTAKTTEP